MFRVVVSFHCPGQVCEGLDLISGGHGRHVLGRMLEQIPPQSERPHLRWGCPPGACPKCWMLFKTPKVLNMQ